MNLWGAQERSAPTHKESIRLCANIIKLLKSEDIVRHFYSFVVQIQLGNGITLVMFSQCLLNNAQWFFKSGSLIDE